jgi:hypothetical protein
MNDGQVFLGYLIIVASIFAGLLFSHFRGEAGGDRLKRTGYQLIIVSFCMLVYLALTTSS